MEEEGTRKRAAEDKSPIEGAEEHPLKKGKAEVQAARGIVRLAFPPLPTSTSSLDEQNLQVILEAVKEFLDEAGKSGDDEGGDQPLTQLLLVIPGELAQGCRALLESAGALAAEAGQGEAKSPASPAAAAPARSFMAVTADLTRLKDAGLESQVLACPCDPRFLPKGSGLVVRVNAAAGPELESSSRLMQGKADENKPIAVKLTSRSQLAAEQGVAYVIQVLPPPHVSTEEEEDGGGGPSSAEAAGRQRLKQCYGRLLQCFHGLLPRLKPIPHPQHQGTDQPATSTASASPPPPSSPPAGVSEELLLLPSLRPEEVPVYRHPGPASHLGGAWEQALVQYLRAPHQHQASVFLDRPECLVVYDGYRKARVHLLLLPKPAFLDLPDIAAARPQHLPRLQALHAIASTIARQLQQREGGGEEVRLGYHALPSLRPLHLHLVSQDFDSPHLKNKKHWNTFTSRFFVSPQRVEQALRGPAGRLLLDRAEYEALEKAPLRCHRCQSPLANMPKLKDHIQHCRAKTITT